MRVCVDLVYIGGEVEGAQHDRQDLAQHPWQPCAFSTRRSRCRHAYHHHHPLWIRSSQSPTSWLQRKCVLANPGSWCALSSFFLTPGSQLPRNHAAVPSAYHHQHLSGSLPQASASNQRQRRTLASFVLTFLQGCCKADM